MGLPVSCTGTCHTPAQFIIFSARNGARFVPYICASVGYNNSGGCRGCRHQKFQKEPVAPRSRRV